MHFETGGRLICTETLRPIPLIYWYRKRTPHLRTEWEVEDIFGLPELESGREYYGGFNLQTFHLAALAAVPFRRTALFKPLLKGLNLLDRAMFVIPWLRRLA
jgi:hypothetical protein